MERVAVKVAVESPVLDRRISYRWRVAARRIGGR